MKRRIINLKMKRKSQLGFSEPVQPDETLTAVIGPTPLPRSELIKRLWNYIDSHGLQDSRRKSLINADDNLRAFFNGKSQVSIFELLGLVSSHLMPRSA